MSNFMQPEILIKGSHWAVECCHGETHYVPCDVVPIPEQFKPGARFDGNGTGMDRAIFNALAEALRDYVPADPEAIEVTRPGYLYRLSAPGYMDCTEWGFAKTLRDVRDALRED